MDEAALTTLQQQSVEVVAAAMSDSACVLTPLAAEVVLAVPALVDEIRHVRAALRLACQDMRGPGVPIDDLLADYLQDADHER